MTVTAVPGAIPLREQVASGGLLVSAVVLDGVEAESVVSGLRSSAGIGDLEIGRRREDAEAIRASDVRCCRVALLGTPRTIPETHLSSRSHELPSGLGEQLLPGGPGVEVLNHARTVARAYR